MSASYRHWIARGERETTTMDNIIEVTSKNFDEVAGEHEVLLLDFWAEWCGPCKSFAEVIKQVAPDYPDVTFGSIDIEKESDLAEEFQVRSVPAVMIMRREVVVYADAGALTATSLRELLNQAKSLDPEKLIQEDQS